MVFDSSDLNPGEVHVWRAGLDVPETRVAEYRQVLAEDERARADRFHFERDRRRFTVARGVLRSLLGRYLGMPAGELRFQYGEYGKPHLEAGSLRFNLSHSHEAALIGVCLEGKIGVDIEYKNADRVTLDVARHFFAEEEVAALSALPRELWSDGFFTCWTRKEAYIKARGEGVSLGLDTFAVSLGAVPELVRSSHGDAEAWEMTDAEVGGDYAGALVVERLREWRYVLLEA